MDSANTENPSLDDVIEYYKQFVDHPAIEEYLKLTVEQRLMKLSAYIQALNTWKACGHQIEIEGYPTPRVAQLARPCRLWGHPKGAARLETLIPSLT